MAAAAMIEELAISDLGVIAHTRLPVGAGFTAITGETGAGKTMVVTALGLLMGERSDAGLVRTGAKQARVSGALSTEDPRVIELVEDAGGDIEDDELLLSRTVSAEGRSRANVGGVRAPVGTLTQLAQRLFCVHGQSEQLRLKSAAEQRDTLDRFGGAPVAEALAAYSDAHTRCGQLQREVDEITSDREARRREAERLRSEVDEITGVDPLEDEDDQLDVKIERLSNLESLREAVARASTALAEESGDPFQADALTLLNSAQQAVSEVADVDQSLRATHDTLSQVTTQLEEVSRDLTRYLSDLDAEGPAQLEEANERKAQLVALKRNYGPELADVLSYVTSASARLVTLDSDDSRLETLEHELHSAREQEREAAEALTRVRTDVAQTLAERVTAELAQLALPDAKLTVTVEETAYGSHGADSIQFLLTSHAGAPARPLAKSASGGELSRIMLALEVVVSETDAVPTFVFDEVDAGVGGAAAIEVGRRLQRLAKSAQVIVVTHLAQVAAFADQHVRVAKDSSGDYTESSCAVLTGTEREREMARLLSGLDHSDSALEHARELLNMGVRS
jgi:DNA repair protein RecN (Recombination protein N)